MPIQPLKSVAISALALGASMAEIRLSTLVIGAFFLSAFFFGRKLLRLPEPVVRGVQWGLGILLLLQGAAGVRPDLTSGGPAILIAGLLFFLDRKSTWPWLGLFSFGVFAASEFFTTVPPNAIPTATPPALENESIRTAVLFSLVLPQIALTAANSVLGTELAFSEYFPRFNASRLRPRLLASIGAGNLLMAAFKGLPFCHGSGGLTAHYRAGARTGWMNGVIGLTLLLLAAQSAEGQAIHPLPAIPSAAILLTVGVHHLGLAVDLLKSRKGRWLLLVASGITLLSKNLLFTLLGAAMVHFIGTRKRAT